MYKIKLLSGTWEFIGKEIYFPPMAKWINQDQYEEGMRWQFCQNLSFGAQEQGSIIETAPNVSPIEMAYIYNYEKQILIVDLEIQDKYEVILSAYGTQSNPVVRLNVLSGEFAAPYLRYVLRRIDNVSAVQCNTHP